MPKTDLVPYLGKLLIDREFTVSVQDPDLPYDIDFAVEVDDGVPRVVELICTARQDGPEIDGRGLRSIPVHTLLADAVRERARVSERRHGQPLAQPAKLIKGVPGRRQRTEMTDELLQEVADVYRGAEPLGKPVQHVANHFSRPGQRVPTNTVRRWVMEARKRGFLEEAKRTQTMAKTARR